MRAQLFVALAAASTIVACALPPLGGPDGAGPQGSGPEALGPSFSLEPSRFAAIPGWSDADLGPALIALLRHCEVWQLRSPESAIGSGRYGGTVADWLPACQAASRVLPGDERAFFETQFVPAQVSGGGEARLTAYFEPVISASRTRSGAFTEPLLRPPTDLVTVDLDAFRSVLSDDALRGAPRALTGRVRDGRVEPYPPREAIRASTEQVIAFAHPADVYNLQVQGSGRLRFSDGSQTRAAYAAQNGYRWRSALGALRRTGALRDVSWGGFRRWLDANPGRSAEALNADPSYVFFDEETIADPAAGPRGAAGVPLTPLGSIAVDPAYHPYGAIVFVDGRYDGAPFRHLLVAQDTGGAIRRGPRRGDVFFGTGGSAGLDAERMNAAAQWWTLLPIRAEVPIAALPESGLESTPH